MSAGSKPDVSLGGHYERAIAFQSLFGEEDCLIVKGIMKHLVVDSRWRGEHGIGRFASEVVSRLPAGWKPLSGHSSPTAFTDVVNPQRLRLPATTVVYSPGFNAGLTRVRQVLTLHDLIHLQIASERSIAKTVYYNTVVRWAVRRAGVVMTVSDASAEVIAKWLRSPSVDIEVVGCGQSESFQRGGDKEDFKRPTFIYVGNLKPHKNVDVLFEALARRPDYDLVVVTSDVESTAEQIAANGLVGRVSIRSGVSDEELARAYRGASGALQPSLLEGFGLPALEALGCGTRVAFWRGCESVKEICAGTGIQVQTATSADEWASAMDRLLHESMAGPIEMPDEWVAQYTWDAVASKVARVLAQARL
jgi:glycosyltransferase involved in cell wall biosynthesis